MHLIAPEVHLRVRVEAAVSGADHVSTAAGIVACANPRSEVVAVRIREPFGIAGLSSGVRPRLAIDPHEVRQDLVGVAQRRRVLVAKPEVQREVRANPPVVLNERLVAVLPHVHRREPGLPLGERRLSEQEARQRLTGAIARSRPGREAVGELIVAAILKETQHVPTEVAEISADFQ